MSFVVGCQRLLLWESWDLRGLWHFCLVNVTTNYLVCSVQNLFPVITSTQPWAPPDTTWNTLGHQSKNPQPITKKLRLTAGLCKNTGLASDLKFGNDIVLGSLSWKCIIQHLSTMTKTEAIYMRLLWYLRDQLTWDAGVHCCVWLFLCLLLLIMAFRDSRTLPIHSKDCFNLVHFNLIYRKKKLDWNKARWVVQVWESWLFYLLLEPWGHGVLYSLAALKPVAYKLHCILISVA